MSEEQPAQTKPEIPKENTSSIETIHTFQEDIAQAVKRDNISIVKIALAENRKRTAEQEDLEERSPTSKKNLTLIIISGILILSGIGLAGYFYFTKKPPQTVVAPPLQTDSIPSDSLIVVDASHLDEKGFAAAIGKEKIKQITLGTIEKIQFTEAAGTSSKSLSANDFFGRLYTRASGSLLRSFEDDFFLGVYSFDGNDAFLLLKLNSYENAYAGMLQWEPYIRSDIGGLFNISTNASSTNTFSDKVIANKDTRSLIEKDGSLLLFYTFVDKSTLLITTKQNTLNEVISRLLKAQSIH